MIPAFPVYLFDLDGTLVDSAEDICGAIRCVLSTTPQSAVADVFLRSYIGRSLIDLFHDLFPGMPDEQIEPMILEYKKHYPARDHACTRLYPGVLEALARLHGRKSTATTKGTPTTRLILERFGLLSFFDHVQGTDGFPPKPAPDVIQASLRVFGAAPGDCLFVGDSAADMEAGRRGGVRTCAVNYGYGDRDEMTRWKPDYWIGDLSELLRSPVAASRWRGTAHAVDLAARGSIS